MELVVLVKEWLLPGTCFVLNIKSLSLCSATSEYQSAECTFHQYLHIFWSVHTELPRYVIVFIQSSSGDETVIANLWSDLGVSSSRTRVRTPVISVNLQERSSMQTRYFPCHEVSMAANWYLSFRVYKPNWAERVPTLCSNKALGKSE